MQLRDMLPTKSNNPTHRRLPQQEQKMRQLEAMQAGPAQGAALPKEMLVVLLRVQLDSELDQ